jgi:HAD superfamily hydrolase (TIGR01662 family)
MSFHAVLFDLGDTLIDFEPMDSRAVFKIGAERTYSYLAQVGCKLPPFKKYCSSQLSAIRWSYLRAKITRQEFNSLHLLRKLAKKHHFQDNEQILTRLAWLWYEPVIEYTSVEPEMIDTLAWLKFRGIKMGIISNTFVPGEVLDEHLRKVGLFSYFPVRIYSSEVGYRKPDKRIFEMALKELKADAATTLFIGDIVKTDMVGARRCGMKTALKQPWANITQHRHADHVIRKVADVLEIIGNNGEG